MLHSTPTSSRCRSLFWQRCGGNTHKCRFNTTSKPGWRQIGRVRDSRLWGSTLQRHHGLIKERRPIKKKNPEPSSSRIKDEDKTISARTHTPIGTLNRVPEAANCSRGTFEMRHGQWKAESGSCYHEHTVQAHDADESVGKAAKWEWRVWKWTGVGGKWGRYRWCVDRLQRLKWLMEEIELRATLPAAVFRRCPRRTLSV